MARSAVCCRQRNGPAPKLWQPTCEIPSVQRRIRMSLQESSPTKRMFLDIPNAAGLAGFSDFAISAESVRETDSHSPDWAEILHFGCRF